MPGSGTLCVANTLSDRHDKQRCSKREITAGWYDLDILKDNECLRGWGVLLGTHFYTKGEAKKLKTSPSFKRQWLGEARVALRAEWCCVSTVAKPSNIIILKNGARFTTTRKTSIAKAIEATDGHISWLNPKEQKSSLNTVHKQHGLTVKSLQDAMCDHRKPRGRIHDTSPQPPSPPWSSPRPSFPPAPGVASRETPRDPVGKPPRPHAFPLPLSIGIARVLPHLSKPSRGWGNEWCGRAEEKIKEDGRGENQQIARSSSNRLSTTRRGKRKVIQAGLKNKETRESVDQRWRLVPLAFFKIMVGKYISGPGQQTRKCTVVKHEDTQAACRSCIPDRKKQRKDKDRALRV